MTELGVFWSEVHQWLFMALLALLLPKRLWWLRGWLAAPYVVRLTDRRSGPLIIESMDSTVVVPPGWNLAVDHTGILDLTRA